MTLRKLHAVPQHAHIRLPDSRQPVQVWAERIATFLVLVATLAVLTYAFFFRGVA